MRRPSRHWRDDRLGDLTRSGLAPYRTAEPSAAVWSQIALELAAPRRRGVSLSWATVLSVTVVVGLALTSLSAQVQRTTAARSRYALGAPVMDGLGTLDYEVAIRASLPGAFDMRVPPEPVRPYLRGTPREAYNRSAWLVDAPTGAGGAVEPLSPVVGQ
jgi:hypothetical protein